MYYKNKQLNQLIRSKEEVPQNGHKKEQMSITGGVLKNVRFTVLQKCDKCSEQLK